MTRRQVQASVLATEVFREMDNDRRREEEWLARAVKGLDENPISAPLKESLLAT